MQQQFGVDVAHVLGQVFKWIIVLVVFGFSLTLSYMFFLAIAPPDKPWFPIAGLALTEGGFLVWMFVFRMIKYHPVHKSIALLMTLACGLCSLVVAGFEFYSLLATHFDLLTNPLVAQYVAILLEIIFGAHFVALFAELLVGEHQKNPFIQRGGVQPAYQIHEQRGEPARPLALKRQSHNQPKAEPATFDQEAEIETSEIELPEEEEESQEQFPMDELIGVPKNLPKPLPPMRKPKKNPQQVSQNPRNPENNLLSEGASLLTQKLRGFIGNGKKVARVRGKTNQTTNENM